MYVLAYYCWRRLQLEQTVGVQPFAEQIAVGNEQLTMTFEAANAIQSGNKQQHRTCATTLVKQLITAVTSVPSLAAIYSSLAISDDTVVLNTLLC
jgi:hypothetical protein